MLLLPLIKRALLAIFLVVCCAVIASADTVNGTLEKVDLMKCEIVVNGLVIKVPSSTTIVGEDRSNRDFAILIENLMQYIGHRITCRYQEVKAERIADKIKIRFWR